MKNIYVLITLVISVGCSIKVPPTTKDTTDTETHLCPPGYIAWKWCNNYGTHACTVDCIDKNGNHLETTTEEGGSSEKGGTGGVGGSGTAGLPNSRDAGSGGIDSEGNSGSITAGSTGSSTGGIGGSILIGTGGSSGSSINPVCTSGSSYFLYEDGSKYIGCIKDYPDSTAYNGLIVKNNCPEKLYTLWYLPGQGIFSWVFGPGTSTTYPYKSSEWVMAVCLDGWSPVTEEGNPWNGERSYTCSQSVYCE